MDPASFDLSTVQDIINVGISPQLAALKSVHEQTDPEKP
jgi:hypothetical protein